ncbi:MULTISPECIES: DUF7118 family protein [Halomicrobium]|uniref:Uncharacterized protein n=2 Tax=Halomicrobium mukohataei TaxID=57705 RepID=C7P0K2_HALMD|nr:MULTISPECIES: hypothetical protein [Halomicrobium]ACV46984.1 conserved hypothetical protein [Halomicrobium mukohataei DSM 12286]QCD65479.1 hypothetical protein E5139_07445 [Halomicrobium mukohataei]QFR20285.1 hypothetical protein GBQ70_07440 [Halomicrobium sp. ZPS1]
MADADAVTRLRQADADRRAARERVESVGAERSEGATEERAVNEESRAPAGEDSLRALRTACEELRALLTEYEGRATGDGDFAAFIEFQDRIAHFTNDLDEELPERTVFEEIDERLQQRRLTEDDFAAVRERIDAAEETADPLVEWEDARERYGEARRAARRRLDTVADRIDDRERLLELGEADLDAPTERLRDPIERYDDAVADAFDAFRSNASAREVLDFVETTALYPLVPFREPPEDLLAYVRGHEAGTEPIPQLLAYAEYSRSKLDHYVEDADALKRSVATSQTYLERLDADPLTVGWPPPAADTLRWQCNERISVVARFAPDVVNDLRAVRALTRRSEYDRLRDSAVARERLTDAERERLWTGAVADELADLRAERDALRDALDELSGLA